MSKLTLIQQFIEKNKQSILKHTAQGLLVLGLATGVLTGCDEATIPDVTNNNDSAIVETSGNNITTNSTDSENVVKINHSDTFYNAKKRWSDIWEIGRGPYDKERAFITKAAPFRFLAEQGAVYYNENGHPRAYGTDENFWNNCCIQSKGFVDTNTPENDFYLMVQYIDGEYDPNNSPEGKMCIATWVLKYTLSNECYQDLLLLSGDFRSNLLIQQIDQEYKPEIISKSVIRYRLFETGLYEGVLSASKNIIWDKDEQWVNYISNIDYQNMTITVDFSDRRENGKIYSYQFAVKQTKLWDLLIQDGFLKNPLTVEERNALTSEDIVRTYQTPVGEGLAYLDIKGYGFVPSEEQKATATLKYDFEPVIIDTFAKSTQFNKYELGQISFSQVNELTRQYAKDNGFIK